MNILRWLSTPDTPTIDRRNFLNVQVDAVGIALANTAAVFLPVFLTRLGASSTQVGLLTTMPAITGFLLAMVIGNFLQRQRNIVPWFSLARLLVVGSYMFTGLITLIAPDNISIYAVLGIWALVTLPQTVVAIGFSVVMNAVAGPNGRFELMTRRWSIMGFTTAISVTLVGWILDQIAFPLNYQVVFMALSVGGLISYYFSSHIKIPDATPKPPQIGLSVLQRAGNYIGQVRQERPFISFVAKRFVFLTGTTLAAPLFPLYYVRVVKANDSWIGIISTASSAVLIIGYFLWSQQSRRRGSRNVLLLSTLGVSIYPLLVSQTVDVRAIALITGLAGLFQAGMDLVFFDELMKTVPYESSATFVSIAQSLTYLSSILSPLMGTALADQIGISGALMVSGAIRLTGFALFAFGGRPRRASPVPEPSALPAPEAQPPESTTSG